MIAVQQARRDQQDEHGRALGELRAVDSEQTFAEQRAAEETGDDDEAAIGQRIVDKPSDCLAVVLGVGLAQFGKQRLRDRAAEKRQELRDAPGDRVDADERRRDEKAQHDDVDVVERPRLQPAEPGVFGEIDETLEVANAGAFDPDGEIPQADHSDEESANNVADEHTDESEAGDDEGDLDEAVAADLDRLEDARDVDFALAFESGFYYGIKELHEDDQGNEDGNRFADVRVDVLAENEDGNCDGRPDRSNEEDACGKIGGGFVVLTDALRDGRRDPDLPGEDEPRDERHDEGVVAEDLRTEDAGEEDRCEEAERGAK